MCKQKFEVTEFEFPSLQLLFSQKHYVPPIHCLFTFPKNYVPPSHCLFTFPKHYGPPIQCLFTKPKLFFPPFHFHFPCYCFDFVIENGGCWKEGHKAADLGILAWRFSNENAGDRRLEQNKIKTRSEDEKKMSLWIFFQRTNGTLDR